MTIPQLRRAWVAEWPRTVPGGPVSLCMRFDREAEGPGIEIQLLPRSREDQTQEKHVRFGWLDERDLPLIRDAIDRYLELRCAEEMAEHR